MSLLKKIASAALTTTAVTRNNYNRLIVNTTTLQEAETILGGRAHSANRRGFDNALVWNNHNDSSRMTLSIELVFRGNVLIDKWICTRNNG